MKDGRTWLVLGLVGIGLWLAWKAKQTATSATALDR